MCNNELLNYDQIDTIMAEKEVGTGRSFLVHFSTISLHQIKDAFSSSRMVLTKSYKKYEILFNTVRNETISMKQFEAETIKPLQEKTHCTFVSLVLYPIRSIFITFNCIPLEKIKLILTNRFDSC